MLRTKRPTRWLLPIVCLALTAGVLLAARADAGDEYSPPDRTFPRNEAGQTYGSALDAAVEPDLIEAYGSNGTLGYVKKTDLYGELPSSPAEALESKARTREAIPLYAADGVTVVGEFVFDEPEIVDP